MRAARPILLVSLAVIAIAAVRTVVLPGRIDMHPHPPADRARIQIRDMSTALDMFLVDVGRYPTQQEGLEALIQNPGTLDSWHGPYLKAGLPLDPWGQAYQYRFPGTNGNNYELFTLNGNAVAAQ
jgi:general secretion pathway protein G